MYLCSLKQLFWKKCAFIVHIIMLFKPKVHNKVSILKFVDSDFYFLILWVFNICLYKWNLESSKAHLRHVFIKSNTHSDFYDTISVLKNCFISVKTKTKSTWHLLLCRQSLCNVKKFKLNSTQNKQKTQKAQKDKK